jgi:aminopeptidase N
MFRTNRLGLALAPAVAALLLVAALVAGCSSTTAGSAVPGTTPAGSAAASTTSPAAPSSRSAADGGITVPSSRAAPSAQAVEPDGAAGTIGSAGIGDPYYPTAGNGGYQVDSYAIDLDYDPDSNNLQSTALINGTVTSTEGLTQFNLDLQPTMTVTEVTVNDAAATFEQQDAELVITPAAPLAADSPLKVTVTYGGQPGLVPGGTSGLSDGGWYRTDSGGAFVAGEPTGASAWFPVNEHPADTATFQVTATVPDKWKVISNGVKQTDPLPDPGPGKATFGWKLSEPVASYLTTIYIDTFTEVDGTLSDGKPVYSAIGPGVGATDLANDTQKVIDVLSGYFGPYPFESAGGIFVGTDTGFALETATRPVYGGSSITTLDTVVHELSHQWFGDDVTIERWSDICLNECFASYGTWLWNEKVNSQNLDSTWKQQMQTVVRQPGFWASPLVDMGPGQEFTRVYDRGPLAMHALRNEIGEDAFFKILKEWPATYGGKNVTFDEFEAYVSSVAGRDLRPFIDAWFRGTTVPAMQFRYPGDLGN